MTELNIPDHVLWKGRDAYYGVDATQPSVDGVEAALRATAPLIVAAELRRMATQWRTEARADTTTVDAQQYAAIVVATNKLNTRADELDPDGVAS